MLRVGLTGNIASGKSQAALVFAEYGAHIVSADAVAHALLRPNTPAFDRIVQAFGEQILLPDGNVDRRKLGRIVFNDESQRLLLNSLIHADVRSGVARRIAEMETRIGAGIIIVEAALMVETGSYRLYDCLVVTVCDPALQIERIIKRDGLNESEARARMAAQMPAEQKRRLAHYTIDTSGTFAQTRSQIRMVYQDLLRLEQEKRNRTPREN